MQIKYTECILKISQAEQITGKAIYSTLVLERRVDIVEYKHAKLHGRIVEKYRNVSNFARHIGVAPSTVLDKLRGNRPITNKDVEKWKDPLDISLEEVGIYFFV